MAERLRVAFLTLYPVETASTRQRIHKNVRHFPPAEVESAIFPGISAASLRRAERIGPGPLGRAVFFLEEVARKLVHLWRARRYDVIVVQKGLTAMNVRGLDRLLFAWGKPVVFDFDDAVHLEAPQAFRAPLLRRLLAPRQVLELLGRADAVVAGNPHLAEVAARHNPRVAVVVTPMDVDWYRTREGRRTGPPVVGWSGSTTTNHYVNALAPVLVRVARAVPDVEFRVISNDDRGIRWSEFRGVATSFRPWQLDSLVDDLLGFDVGVMPLTDDEWSQSKCGGKILQYMACGIPPVASPVGINTDVIEDGVSGRLAGDDDAWVAHLVELLWDAEARARMGRAARRRVEERYSNRVTSPQLLAVVRQAAQRDALRGGNRQPGAGDREEGR